MKHIRKYTIILFMSFLWTGCEDESFVEIDSLSALGDEFFAHEKVKVWMAVKTNDLPSARYTWSCDGGRLTQPQTLDENTWQAPREPGVYTVACTVDVNGVKQTRTREMYVSSFYFDKLERTPHTLTTNSSSSNLVTDPATGTSHLEVRVNSTTATRGYVQRAFDDPELHVPFSTKAQVGWISNFPLKEITKGSSTAQNTLYYEWTLRRDPDQQDDVYIDNIRFEWYPVGKSNGLPLDNGQPWNGTFRIQQRNLATNGTTALSVYVNHPELTFAKNEFKNVSMSIDADYRTHVYVDGIEILSTDVIKDWRITHGSKDDIYINQWRINYVSNTGQTPLIYIDEAIALNEGTILK